MYRSFVAAFLLTAGAALSWAAEPAPILATDSAAVQKLFADPPCQYSSGPLWVWNDMLTDEQITSTLRDLAGQKVKQVFVHPRPGLMTPYLSPEWFRLWRVALREAERLDMNVWIYDENSYPSGFAGGAVPELMPESRGRGLAFSDGTQPGSAADRVLAQFRLTDQGFEEVTQKIRDGEKPAEGRYLTVAVRRAPISPWFGNRSYVDLLYPGVTQKFLEVTHEAYRRELGEEFGRRIPGSFSDEPQIRPARSPAWTDDLPEQFQKRFGYSLVGNLPSLVRPLGDWRKVRHDYYQLLMELMVERWARPYHDYCEKHHLEWTGHYWDHMWPDCGYVPDNMAMYAWHQRPAIDCLKNMYQEDTNAQFGNVRMVKELGSVANQLGRKRTLCEVYGAGGWDLRLEDMKRIADWMGTLGVNTFCQHLSFVTIRGARKWDHPQSFSYHEPWWEAYHVMAQYLTRLSLVASAGEERNHVLVIEPTTTAWLYQDDPSAKKHLEQLGEQFQSFVVALSKAQVEYDIGSEYVIASHGSCRALPQKAGQPAASELCVGQRGYDVVVVPRGTETLQATTVKWLEPWVRRGGPVICCGPPPALVDARPSDRVRELAKSPSWTECDPSDVATRLTIRADDGCAIYRVDGDPGILYHQRRMLADGQLVILVNSHATLPVHGSLMAPGRAVERWNLMSGRIEPYAFTEEGTATRWAGMVHASFSLPPCGSLVLFIPNTARGGPKALAAPKPRAVPASGAPGTRCLGPNVLPIDYFDVSAGGQHKSGLYCYQACHFAFRANGMERDPWDSGVQFRDEIISKKFPAGSSCEATYRFVVEKEVPRPLWIVVERPDLYTVACNGKPVAAEKGAWWLDKSFGKIDITAAVRLGENAVTIKAAPMNMYHELMPAYVLGDFALRPIAAGFAIVPPEPLKLGKWNEQGMPFYATGVGYAQKFELPARVGRYQVRLPKRPGAPSWYGSVAKVVVNGKPAGYIGWAPWTCDVTDAIVPGVNSIEVQVIGTLRNTLGPHHAGHVVGEAWPGHFHQAPETGPPPGDKYDTLGYGLFEPFVLEQVAP